MTLDKKISKESSGLLSRANEFFRNKILIYPALVLATGVGALTLLTSCGEYEKDNPRISSQSSNLVNPPQGSMSFIPGGVFLMGCEPEDTRCRPNEMPRHKIHLDNFFIDTYEVINQEYADYLNNENQENNCFGAPCAYSAHEYFWGGDNFGMYESEGIWNIDETYENRSVVLITWEGAKAFCEANGKRLPTEAEWEKAAKGGGNTHKIYPWGDEWETNSSNYLGNHDIYERGHYAWTTPPGFFKGNTTNNPARPGNGRSPFGVHDMAGNVWEWVNDWYDGDYYSTYESDKWPRNPTGPEGPLTYHTVRGGAWNDQPHETNHHRTSHRDYFLNIEEQYSNALGFRCAKDSNPLPKEVNLNF